MHVRFTKNEPAAQADTLICIRPDGSSTTGEMPRQGVLPHNVFHFITENILGWHDAFFGRIARGATIEEMTDKLHHRNLAWGKMAQALQAESLVQCLQEEQWSGNADPAHFAERLIATCRRNGVPPPQVTAEELTSVREALRDFGAAWRPLPIGASLERTFTT